MMHKQRSLALSSRRSIAGWVGGGGLGEDQHSTARLAASVVGAAHLLDPEW